MAFLGNDSLSQILPNLIDPFDVTRLKSAHYELSIGEEAFVTGDNSDSKTILAENESITIEPGQFALLLTEEKVTIPNDKIAFISIKAGQKFKGLVNISGFHVDPGFKGKLLFSVYNAGPSKILLERGQKCFLIWYSELIGNASYNGVHNNQEKIPIKHIENLTGDLASPNVLLTRITEINSQITRHWFAIGLILVACIGISTKFYWQKTQYEDGFNDGYNKKQIEEKVTNKVDLIINKKMDSIIGAKFDKINIIRDTITIQK
ncbi:dCTP deaminase domain-containing protein [Tenacibaculum finnmarkense]|uniref:Deoxycytidine triphosphate deaminase family protein n=1 Tax=Tenacibaculum finnmarkense genomovar ulcerans TaxID=2781388 RepID=A0A2I2M7C3_9FLAO|nr:deoxycytidine triphosphate deaminase [Tenacibaculum finnmarkense]MBE7698177.1 deoxycytidine triphosphate deaminase [Tenacibaculum finnmarkense genomovar ulcerans]MCG8236690.1 deoxycytidine triphosphate deaminase [Tenacibaculum finnmarkense genomovar ulcerans]MCG8830911.1 deoxycytidine triphosphate deaminase [Tenacibaculum finnmarkense]SOU88453.1 Deoxycytidine triphosphate deaminase family protein [Tenacibaculum finnmarkense genomovar ulcerans]